MTRSRKTFAAAALILAIGLTGWAGCAAESPQPTSDEDRPPIVVYESSIHFSHGHVWQPAGTRKWAPLHPGGRDFGRFEVYVVDRTNATGTVCIAQGATVDFEYELTAGGTQTFTLVKEGPRRPVLSTANLELEHNQHRLKSKDTDAGYIKQVKVDGKPCGGPFAEDRKIRVYVEFVD